MAVQYIVRNSHDQNYRRHTTAYITGRAGKMLAKN